VKNNRTAEREAVPQRYRVLRSVQQQQGALLWLEQESRVRGRGRMTLCMGRAWMLEFIFLRRGGLAFWQDGRRILPPGESFCVFYAPFSITEIAMAHAHLDWVGVAGAEDVQEREAVIFPFALRQRPRNAREALALFRRRPQPVPIGITARAPRLAERAKDRLAGCYADGASLAGVAAQLGVTHAHLARTFKSAYGLTPLEYLHRLRMNDAFYLLSQGQRIVDVSLDVGYNDLSRFYKQFRKIAPMPPGSCRQEFFATSKNAKT
jgi:AraC-like DNA-binding protein